MTDAGELKVVNNAAERRFEVRLGDEIAFTEYRIEDDAIRFPHTEVPKAFEGRGVGSLLVKAGMQFAREQGLPVKPACSFVAGYIAKHPEYHDLVHPNWRKRVGV